MDFGRKHRTFSITEFLFQSPPRLVLLSFCVVILVGSLLLMLPQATVGAGGLSFWNSLFTSTSATCVTGLIVLDTGSDFTVLGQIIILILIQIGGLGIMTISTFFIYLISGRLGIFEREVLFDTLSQDPMRNLTRLLITVFLYTLAIEAIGFLLLTLGFWRFFPLRSAAYLGLFHSISAFCNAGFSLFSDSFIDFKGDPLIGLTVCTLIILGGLGFVVIYDLYLNRRTTLRLFISRLSLHSRLVLTVTGWLIAGGTLAFYLLERSNTLAGLPVPRQILVALFQSVTTRTAGFNSVEVPALANSTLFLFMVLMFIGASPASCGGGIKTTTFAILIRSIAARFRMRGDVNFYERRIPQETVSKMTAIVFFTLFTLVVFTLCLLITELPEISHARIRGTFLEYAFEAMSAYGTVGLSMGVTPHLMNTGKVLIVLLMFIGRLGPLTIAIALKGRREPKYRYMKENILVG